MKKILQLLINILYTCYKITYSQNSGVHAVQYDKFYPSFRENTKNILHEIINIHLFNSQQEIHLMDLEEITFNDLLNSILNHQLKPPNLIYSFISNPIQSQEYQTKYIYSDKVLPQITIIRLITLVFSSRYIVFYAKAISISYKNLLYNMISFKSTCIVVSKFSIFKVKYNTVPFIITPKV